MIADYNIGNYEVQVDDKALLAQVVYLPTGKPLAKFKGETAWADARRHADDLFFTVDHR